MTVDDRSDEAWLMLGSARQLLGMGIPRRKCSRNVGYAECSAGLGISWEQRRREIDERVTDNRR